MVSIYRTNSYLILKKLDPYVTILYEVVKNTVPHVRLCQQSSDSTYRLLDTIRTSVICSELQFLELCSEAMLTMPNAFLVKILS
jgi:hypothetical protein